MGYLIHIKGQRQQLLAMLNSALFLAQEAVKILLL